MTRKFWMATALALAMVGGAYAQGTPSEPKQQSDKADKDKKPRKPRKPSKAKKPDPTSQAPAKK